MSIIKLTTTGERHQPEACFVNTSHIAAVRAATKFSMDDRTESDVILVGGEKVRVQERPSQIAELLGPYT